MSVERTDQVFGNSPQHEMSVESASRALALVLFPTVDDQSIISLIQNLDREGILHLLAQQPSMNGRVTLSDHVVSPQKADTFDVSLADIQTARRAVFAFGRLYLFQEQEWRTVAPLFGETAPCKPMSEYRRYNEFLRAALYTFIADPQLDWTEEEDALRNYFIDTFTPVCFDGLFGGGFISTDGTSSIETEAFARYQRAKKARSNS